MLTAILEPQFSLQIFAQFYARACRFRLGWPANFVDVVDNTHTAFAFGWQGFAAGIYTHGPIRERSVMGHKKMDFDAVVARPKLCPAFHTSTSLRY